MRAPRQVLLFALFLLAVLLPGCGEGSDASGSSDASPGITGSLPIQADLLFVLRGPATIADGRIEVDTDAVEWFTERPARRAGVANVAELVEEWKTFGFTQDPPNAALSGEESDGTVVLTKPELTSAGVSFAFRPLHGEANDGEDERLSVFVDGSEWKTDMHVYVKVVKDPETGRVGWCGGSEQTVLDDPVINTAPENWSYAPVGSITLSGSNQEIFTAASKSGNTNFSVTYDVECQGGNGLAPVGQVRFKGKVPDNLNPDEFSCDPANLVPSSHSEHLFCAGGSGTGYHVDTYTTLEYNQSDVNDQITD